MDENKLSILMQNDTVTRLVKAVMMTSHVWTTRHDGAAVSLWQLQRIFGILLRVLDMSEDVNQREMDNIESRLDFYPVPH